ASSLAQAPLWGLGKVVALEHPELACRLVDLDTSEQSEALAAELLADSAEGQVALRGPRRLVARLVQSRRGKPSGWSLRGERTYLITGGLGGLGLEVAGWLAARGAKHLVLNGRSAAGDAAEAVLARLRRSGVQVEVLLADVAREEEVRRLLGQMEALLPPLAGVIHAVGVLRDGTLVNQNWQRFAEVLAPKVLG